MYLDKKRTLNLLKQYQYESAGEFKHGENAAYTRIIRAIESGILDVETNRQQTKSD